MKYHIGKTIIEGVYRRFPRRGLNQDNSKPEALFTNSGFLHKFYLFLSNK